MLTTGQMKKLQNKVAKQVEAKAKVRDKAQDAIISEINATQKKKRDTIIAKIEAIQKEHPDRGGCICLWKGINYCLKDGKLISIPSQERPGSDFDLVQRGDQDDVYYLMSEEEYKETSRIMKWMSEHYAEIKFSLHNIKSAQGKDSLTQSKDSLTAMLMLGKVSEDFQKDFPDKSILDLKEWIETFDHLMKQSL